MEKYRINFIDNIPSNFFGVFNSQNEKDYLMFSDFKRIDNLDISAKFEISENDEKKLYHWDCLPLNKGSYILVNKKNAVYSALFV